MARATRQLSLFILAQLYLLATSTSHGHGHGNSTASSFCHLDQAASLVQLKTSFTFDDSTTTLPSWRPGTDCCLWEGVGCDDGVSGGTHVTVLDLSGRGIYSYGFHAALFNLTSLRYLDLSRNNFGRSRLPAVGFERLAKLTHLNLSYSGIYGQIPIVIAKLTSLMTLDFSSLHDIVDYHKDPGHYPLFCFYNNLMLQDPNLETLVANLTNLRKLYLDGVEISSRGENWCNGLGNAVPYLEVLSMEHCQLQGPICSSMSSLLALTVINLKNNLRISGVVPEFLSDFFNLSVLQLSYNNLSGWFPRTIFQLKSIRVIDLSGNIELFGNIPEFPNGASLEILNLQYTNFSSIKLSSFSNLLSLSYLGFLGSSISMESTDLLFDKFNSLQKLKLSFWRYSGQLGPFFSWIKSLKNLRSLQLSDCYSCKMMPTMIDNLTSLTSLEITDSHFIEQISPSIGNLTELTSLTISFSTLSGTLPSTIGNLKKLRSLDMSYTDLSGPVTHIGHLSKLTVLELKHCMLSGTITNIIVNLTQLIYVDISENNLTGEIPTSLFTSPTILLLDLSSNKLSGQLQEFDTLYSHMKRLYLSENQITGQIPASLFQLTSLESLDLHSNKLTGLVQLSAFWKFRKLVYLDLSNNMLSVIDGKGSKSSVPLLPKLTGLGLASCNMTTIPRFLMHVNWISVLDLSSNNINGTIPKWIWHTWEESLIILNLSRNIFTHMELTSYVLPSNHLETLDLSFNRLQGQIPMPEANSQSYKQVLDYSNNRFSSVMPNLTASLSKIVYLRISKNNISGPIPHAICDLRNLEVLDLSYNNFSGVIPTCLIEDTSLRTLSLRDNNLEGALPYNVSKNCNLVSIDLHGNKIEGQLPRSLSNCADLEVLDIGNNQILDTFPFWLSRIWSLRVLVLRSNKFYGSLAYPSRESKFWDQFLFLQIIDISSNNFSGNLDPQWFEKLIYVMRKFNDTGNTIQTTFYGTYYSNTISITYKGQYVTFEKVLTALTAVDFSNNRLDGNIPESTGKLVSLHVLNMSHNAFTGRIPQKMGEMFQLESLDLSSNNLSGEIPQELTNLTFLGTLNLCGNKLDGRIPQSRQFATFENTSYEGNTGLCGPPLSKPCGSTSNQNEEAHVNISGDHVDIILLLFIGVGFGIGFAAGILMKWGKIGKWIQIV